MNESIQSSSLRTEKLSVDIEKYVVHYLQDGRVEVEVEQDLTSKLKDGKVTDAHAASHGSLVVLFGLDGDPSDRIFVDNRLGGNEIEQGLLMARESIERALRGLPVPRKTIES